MQEAANGGRDEEEQQQRHVLVTPHWRAVFNRYDLNGDGKISLAELTTSLTSDSFTHDIPEETVRKIMQRADEDQNGYLSYEEFVKMIQNPDNKNFFGHLFNRYVHYTIPRRKTVQQFHLEETETEAGEYEEAYSCWPPAVGMVVLSILEIATYMYDSINAGNTMATGPVATVLIYDPYKRYEAWRYLTYMFVHVGSMHLIVNLVVQIMLGVPLEMVHHSWRVWLVYLAGVVAGSLGTSITDPHVFLAGASGGVYALITAHIATIIMNWSEMQYAIWQLLFFLLLTGMDVGTAIYNRYILDQNDKVGYAAHLCGAIAGLLVGINVLKNLDVKPWETKLRWASISFYFILMLAAIIWNAAFPSYFLPPR